MTLVISVNPEPTKSNIERAFELERLVFFSDAVFAIAMTLMAIELRPPANLDPNTSEQLLRELLSDWPHFFAFFLSFWIIAVYWVAHHRYFRYILRYDEGLTGRNLLMLFFVVLVPFTALLLGEDGDLIVAVWFYAANLILLGLSGAWMWHHASKNHRLIAPDLDERVIRGVQLRSLATPLAAVIVIFLSFFLGSFANVAFVLSFVFQRAISRRFPATHQSE